MSMKFFCDIDFNHPFIKTKTQRCLERERSLLTGASRLSQDLHSKAIPAEAQFPAAKKAEARKMSHCGRCPKKSPEAQWISAQSNKIRAHAAGTDSTALKSALLGTGLWLGMHSFHVRNFRPVPGAEQAQSSLV